MKADETVSSRRIRWLLGSPVFAATLALATTASAVEYESEVDVETEDDLEELRASGHIEDDTYEVLVDLLERGVDLDKASRDELYNLPNLTYEDVDRIIAYREEAGFIYDPADLVAAGVLTEEQAENIAPFVIVKERDKTLAATNGRVRIQSAWSPVDDLGPTSALQARVTTLRHFSAGFAAVTTRKRVSNVEWEGDPPFGLDEYERQGILTADAPTTRLQVPKYYVAYDRDKWGVIVGTYTIGFGQRLTFDSTPRYSPNGYYRDDTVRYRPEMGMDCKESGGDIEYGLEDSPCSGDVLYDVSLSDFAWSERQRGVAVRAEHLGTKKRDAGLQLVAWASELPHSVYQYDIYHTGSNLAEQKCDDPRRSNEDDYEDICKAPQVYKNPVNLGETTTRFKFHTLPKLYSERLAGANVSYFLNRRTHVGTTAYAADIVWPDGSEIDFNSHARTPFGGSFGAAGADAAWGMNWLDVFFEAAHSFDQMPGAGGGPAAILRATATWKRNEIEWSNRYYDQDYANPFAGPISAADEYDGLRARDEIGTRVKYQGELLDRRLVLRGQTDFWVQLSENQPKTETYVKADYQVIDQLRPGLWLDFRSKDLNNFDHQACYDVVQEYTETNEPVPCQGEKITVRPRITVDPIREVKVRLEYAFSWYDSPYFDEHFARDRVFYSYVSAKPAEAVRLKARLAWGEENIAQGHRGEEYLWVYGDVSYRFPSRTRVGFRYDVKTYLDGRESTETRDPDPQHWGRLDIEQKF